MGRQITTILQGSRPDRIKLSKAEALIYLDLPGSTGRQILGYYLHGCNPKARILVCELDEMLAVYAGRASRRAAKARARAKTVLFAEARS